MKRVSLFFVACCLAGCVSFRPTQQDAFIDDDGNVLVVEYGVSSKPYTYTMVSPANGVEFTCTDTKMVRALLPSGETIVCYICQNATTMGTMYMTRDKKWKYLTVGLASRIYLWDSEIGDYVLVFEGSICPSALEGR